MKGFVYGVFAVSAVVVSLCLAAPEPAVVPGPTDWTLDVRFEHLQRIAVPLGSAQEPKLFWYVILTLTNKTNSDVDFHHSCELVTDNFQIIRAGLNTPAAVFERVKERHQSRYPFLEHLERANSKILQGQDNTKDIAVIWPDFDVKARGVKLFITGLSNDTAVIDHPIAKDPAGHPVKVYLRKTLELSYALGGDTTLRPDIKVTYNGKRWVMR